MLKRTQLLFLLLVLIAVAAPRLIDLDGVVTVDEYYWVRRSANVNYALAHHDYAATYQKYHPGVVTQTLGALSMLVSFPDYHIIAPGQLDVNRFALFADVVHNTGRNELDILVAGRVAMILAISLLLGASYLAARNLVGDWAALAGILLVAFDPYYLGHSRLLQTEAIMSALVLLSVLLLINYLRQPRLLLLLAAGAVAGAACLAKAPAVIMAPYMTLLLAASAYDYWRQQQSGDQKLLPVILQRWLKPLLLGLVALALTYVILWPAMWVQPRQTLNRVYGKALNYSDIELDGAVEEELAPDEALGYIQSLLWRTTPVTWLALLLTLAWLLLQRQPSATRQTILWLAIFAAAFLAMMALSSGGGKRAPHYILAVHVTLNLLAGIGAAVLLQGLRPRLIAPVIVMLATLQLGSALGQAPYYFTYTNPLMGTPARGGRAGRYRLR